MWKKRSPACLVFISSAPANCCLVCGRQIIIALNICQDPFVSCLLIFFIWANALLYFYFFSFFLKKELFYKNVVCQQAGWAFKCKEKNGKRHYKGSIANVHTLTISSQDNWIDSVSYILFSQFVKKIYILNALPKMTNIAPCSTLSCYPHTC